MLCFLESYLDDVEFYFFMMVKKVLKFEFVVLSLGKEDKQLVLGFVEKLFREFIRQLWNFLIIIGMMILKVVFKILFGVQDFEVVFVKLDQKDLVFFI